MKRMTMLAAMMALGLSTGAMAQMATTNQQMMPNGAMRTTTRVETPDGSHSTTRVERPDGSTRVVHRSTDMNGDSRVAVRERMGDQMDVHDRVERVGGYGDGGRRTVVARRGGRVCKTVFHHGMMHRRCWTRHHGW